jgi:hypothetical protein
MIRKGTAAAFSHANIRCGPDWSVGGAGARPTALGFVQMGATQRGPCLFVSTCTPR